MECQQVNQLQEIIFCRAWEPFGQGKQASVPRRHPQFLAAPIFSSYRSLHSILWVNSPI